MDIRNCQLTLQRRSFMSASVATVISAFSTPTWAHNDAGVVNPPIAPPPVSLALEDKSKTTLQALLKDHVTGVQLMFTTCQATCPIQGALFADAAKKLGDRVKPAQLLSISIDPGQDTEERLRDWLKRFGQSPRWHAARPDATQMKSLITFLKATNAPPDPHTGQVYFFNGRGELVLRSVDFPPATEIVRILEAVAKRG